MTILASLTPIHNDDRRARWAALRAAFPNMTRAERMFAVRPVTRINLATKSPKAACVPMASVSPTDGRKRGTDQRGGGVERTGDSRSRRHAGNGQRLVRRTEPSEWLTCAQRQAKHSLSRGSVRPASPNLCPTMSEPAGPVTVRDGEQCSRIAKGQGVSGRVAPSFATRKGRARRALKFVGEVLGGAALLWLRVVRDAIGLAVFLGFALWPYWPVWML